MMEEVLRAYLAAKRLAEGPDELGHHEHDETIKDLGRAVVAFGSQELDDIKQMYDD
jgi:hypothetical protein